MTVLLSSGMLLLSLLSISEATFFNKYSSSWSSSVKPYSSSFRTNDFSYSPPPQAPVRGSGSWQQQQQRQAAQTFVPRALCDTVVYGYNPGKRPGRQCDRETVCNQGRSRFS